MQATGNQMRCLGAFLNFLFIQQELFIRFTENTLNFQKINKKPVKRKIQLFSFYFFFQLGEWLRKNLIIFCKHSPRLWKGTKIWQFS